MVDGFIVICHDQTEAATFKLGKPGPEGRTEIKGSALGIENTQNPKHETRNNI